MPDDLEKPGEDTPKYNEILRAATSHDLEELKNVMANAPQKVIERAMSTLEENTKKTAEDYEVLAVTKKGLEELQQARVDVASTPASSTEAVVTTPEKTATTGEAPTSKWEQGIAFVMGLFSKGESFVKNTFESTQNMFGKYSDTASKIILGVLSSLYSPPAAPSTPAAGTSGGLLGTIEQVKNGIWQALSQRLFLNSIGLYAHRKLVSGEMVKAAEKQKKEGDNITIASLDDPALEEFLKKRRENSTISIDSLMLSYITKQRAVSETKPLNLSVSLADLLSQDAVVEKAKTEAENEKIATLKRVWSPVQISTITDGPKALAVRENNLGPWNLTLPLSEVGADGQPISPQNILLREAINDLPTCREIQIVLDGANGEKPVMSFNPIEEKRSVQIPLGTKNLETLGEALKAIHGGGRIESVVFDKKSGLGIDKPRIKFENGKLTVNAHEQTIGYLTQIESIQATINAKESVTFTYNGNTWDEETKISAS